MTERYQAVESTVLCGDHDAWWQVRDLWDRQTLLGYYYEAGARKMAQALNEGNSRKAIFERRDPTPVGPVLFDERNEFDDQ